MGDRVSGDTGRQRPTAALAKGKASLKSHTIKGHQQKGQTTRTKVLYGAAKRENGKDKWGVGHQGERKARNEAWGGCPIWQLNAKAYVWGMVEKSVFDIPPLKRALRASTGTEAGPG